MAIYKNLYLPSGGGVISYNQQADQARDTANILIGLGGTGIDCIRTIKEQVYKRLKPDEPDALIATYRHIKFLGVDDDYRSEEFLVPSDFFSIYNNLWDLLCNRASINLSEEFDWFRSDKIKRAYLRGASGARGIRQVGRFQLMSKAEEFIQTLKQKIDLAKSKLVNPTVNIHIIAGISGRTGSGIFLDTCYITRDILKGDQL